MPGQKERKKVFQKMTIGRRNGEGVSVLTEVRSSRGAKVDLIQEWLGWSWEGRPLLSNRLVVVAAR